MANDKLDLASAKVGFIIGIRYERTFGIEDNLGNIVDDILYQEESLFNPSFFPQIHSSLEEKLIGDGQKGRFLRINSTDVILGINVRQLDGITIEMIEIEFEKRIIEGIFRNYKLRRIQRIGYISQYALTDGKLAMNFLGKTDIDTNNVKVSFKKTHPLPMSLIKKRVNDFCNIIYEVVKPPEQDELVVQNDFQVFFDPPLNDSTELPYDTFLKECKLFNSGTFTNWLQKYLG